MTTRQKFRRGMASGLDLILAEVVNLLAKELSKLFLGKYKDCLSSGLFLRVGKIAKLVVIGEACEFGNDSSSFRTICLLDCIRTLYEHLIILRTGQKIRET